MIVGDTWDDMRMSLFQHMEKHESLHRGDDRRIAANTGFGCRLCDVTLEDENDLDKNMIKLRRSSSKSRRQPSFKSPNKPRRGRSRSFDYEGFILIFL